MKSQTSTTNKVRHTTLFLILAIMLSGCLGTPEDPLGGGGNAVQHALGETHVTAEPERIVTLEWSYTEAVLAMDRQPVGVADVDGYSRLVDTDPGLDGDVVDVGTRQEPDLETIASLQPDLIIGVKFRHEDLYSTLSKIAPTLIFDPWPEDGDQIGRMRETVRAIGQALHDNPAAVRALGDLDAALRIGKVAVENGGHAGSPFVLAQVLAPEYGDLRLFQQHHAAVQIIDDLGLVPVWEDAFSLNGFSTVGLEALERVSSARFLYVPSTGADLDRYDDNPTWQNLTFVQNEWLYDLSGAWLLPGPLSGQAFIDKVVSALGEHVSNETPTQQEEGPAREIDHALGTTAINGTPKRVVALEWNFVETVLALGLQPVGVADKQGFEDWVEIGIELEESVVDVGTRQEPSLEKIAELEPDLILAVKFRHEDIYDELSGIAPTLVYEAFPPASSSHTQFTMMEHVTDQVAEALWRVETGDQVLAEMHQHLKDAKRSLKAHDHSGREVLVTQVFTMDDTPVLRVFTDNSLAIETAHRMGLENAWPEDSQVYGYSTVNMEALAPVQHADFFYVAQDDDNPVEDQWNDNPVWNSYTFVQEDRVYPLGEDTWLFPGPLGVERMADKIVENYIE